MHLVLWLPKVGRDASYGFYGVIVHATNDATTTPNHQRCGCAEKPIGIPLPLLHKYKFGRLLFDGDVVAVKRCYEKYVKSIASFFTHCNL